MSAYTVDGMEGGIRNLNDLLSVICDVQFELGIDERDARINGLLWIARDLAEGLVECHEKEVRERASRPIHMVGGQRNG